MTRTSYFWVMAMTAAVCAEPAVHLSARETAVDRVEATVTVTDVQNLDSYSLDVRYDTNAVAVTYAGIAGQGKAAKNALDDGRRQVIPIVKKEPGVVRISATAAGKTPTGLVEEGVLGVVAFERLSSQLSPGIRLENVRLLNHERKEIDLGDGGEEQ